MPESFVGKLKGAEDVFTFRDFILLPGRSTVEPREIRISSQVSRNIEVGVPMVSSPMDTVTEWKMAARMAALGGVGVIHRNLGIDDQVGQVKRVKREGADGGSVDESGRPLVGAAVSPMDPKRCRALDKVADFLVCDVAHFHNSNVLKAAAKVLPDLSKDFVVGNVGSAAAVRDAVAELPRVDGFRAGIGSGSICITSEVTRVGAPTLHAVAQVASELRGEGLRIPVIADGGIRGPGDATLALAAGASAVMLGSLLAGSDESPGEVIRRRGRRVKAYRGMASSASRSRRFALDRYSVPSKGLDEGVEAYVPYSGRLDDTVSRFCDGLRAAFGYAGAKDIPTLWERARFGRVSAHGSTELGSHSVERAGTP